MSYQYKPTKAEEKAAALLRDKGWNVGEPRCPDCHGNGFVWAIESHPVFGGGVNSAVINSTVSMVSCPRGCPRAWNYMLSGLQSARTVTADGTAGMRRGVS